MKAATGPGCRGQAQVQRTVFVISGKTGSLTVKARLSWGSPRQGTMPHGIQRPFRQPSVPPVPGKRFSHVFQNIVTT